MTKSKPETVKKAGRGRPEFVPTDDDRERVQVLKAQGMSNEAIAAALDIHQQTLVKHFSIELECAVAKKTADVMMARYRSAMGGSVPAQNKFLELAGAMPPSKLKPKAPRAPKLGKKEVAIEEAQHAHEGSDWSDLVN
jgi:predicted ArsR family transcriptional regulator